MSDTTYTVLELIHDQSFRRMVKGQADADEINRWNRWMEESDANREIAKDAIAEIAGFTFKDLEEIPVANEWKRLHTATLGKKRIKLPRIPRNNDGLKWIYRIAAILVLGALIGIGVHEYSKSNSSAPKVKQITEAKTITTGSGERKTITFSNGSKIILNSNSAMTYHIGLMHKQPIDVMLDGEAYFESSKKASKINPVFAVQTGDGVIRDIGTKFLVTTQNNHSRVVLQAGKVQVKMNNQRKGDQYITMKKGELLSFDRSRILRQKMVNATFYTSWATGFMQFDHTSIQEFAGYVAKRFDVDVQVVDPKLADITIDGSIYFKSLPGLVRSVTKVARIPAYQSKDKKTVYIGDTARSRKN